MREVPVRDDSMWNSTVGFQAPTVVSNQEILQHIEFLCCLPIGVLSESNSPPPSVGDGVSCEPCGGGACRPHRAV